MQAGAAEAEAGGGADRLYRRLGWTPIGDIQGYALRPQGGFCGITVFYRDLAT